MGERRQGSSARHPDRETWDPPLPPRGPVPSGRVYPGGCGAQGTGSAICTATQEPVSRTLPGAAWCRGAGGRGVWPGVWGPGEWGPRAAPARAVGTEREQPGLMAELPFLYEMQMGESGPAPTAQLPGHARTAGSCLAGRCHGTARSATATLGSVPGACRERATPSFRR